MTPPHRWLAEFAGASALLIVVVGSGIMAESLSPNHLGFALLANSLATGAGLYVLIQSLSKVSGAHLNPVVSWAEWRWKRLSGRDFAAYSLAQTAGGIFGVFLTHAMFGQNVFQLSAHRREQFGLFLSEILATFGLVLVIGLGRDPARKDVPALVALYVMAAYWCTSSTSFANPAVTLARSFSDSFSGIHWSSTPTFVLAQILGGGLAIAVSKLWKMESI